MRRVDVTPEVMAAARRLSPRIMLSSDEPVLPTNVTAYMQGCRVIDPEGEATGPVGEFTPMTLPALTTKHKLQHVGALPDTGLEDAPAYCHVTRLHDDHGGGYRFQYWLFWALNPFCGRAGTHQADWERVSVFTNKDFQPVRICVSAHGYSEQQWYEVNDLVMWHGRDASHPVVICCKGSHALHGAFDKQALGDGLALARWSCFPRLCCVASDTWRAPGQFWEPRVVVITENTPWVKYKGDWGYDSYKKRGRVSSLHRRPEWSEEESALSSDNWCQPCCLLPLREAAAWLKKRFGKA